MKISELNAATTIGKDDTHVIVQSGETKKVADSVISYKELRMRGDEIIQNSKLGSIEGQASVHDCQILVKQPTGGVVTMLLLYRTSSTYHIVARNANLGTTLYSSTVVTTTGWAPRMFPIADDTVRIVYTKSRTAVYYKDLTVSTGDLSAEANFQVQIKDGEGDYEVAEQLTIACFLEHCANVSGIDYTDGAFDTFAARNILVEDTQQLQQVGANYYLSALVLADSHPSGDTGGIACLMVSTDLTTWQLLDPVFITTTINEQRDHEFSATYLGTTWYGLSRYNTQNFDTSGYKFYKSADGNTWTDQGHFCALPQAMKGLRHAVYKHTLRYLAPSGTNLNLTTSAGAFILYQRIPRADTINAVIGTHAARVELGLVFTTDFETFTEVAHISDRRGMHYPSMCIYQDTIYMAWSSGYLGTQYLGSIMYSTYNLNKI
jgi:hypothetical protein